MTFDTAIFATRALAPIDDPPIWGYHHIIHLVKGSNLLLTHGTDFSAWIIYCLNIKNPFVKFQLTKTDSGDAI
jgi:hypothetical protein